VVVGLDRDQPAFGQTAYPAVPTCLPRGYLCGRLWPKAVGLNGDLFALRLDTSRAPSHPLR
jgi:hypothetical protein